MDQKKHIDWSDFDLLCIAKFALRHFWMAILCALSFVMLAYLVMSLAIAPTYTSTVTFSITSRNAAGSTFGNVAVTETVAKRFADLVSSELVFSDAAARLGMKTFPAEVAVDVPDNTNILNMKVTASTPELAYKSSLAIMECLPVYADRVHSSAFLENRRLLISNGSYH